MNRQHRNVYSTPKGFTHTVYMDVPLESIEEWAYELELIRTAQPGDEVVIRIDSPGGNVNVALAFLSAMGESQAHIKTVIEGTAASAASMVFLGGHEKQVNDLGEILVHTASFRTGGSEHEVFDYVVHSRKQVHKLIDKIYSGFLLPDELVKIKEGKQHWMTADEIIERLEREHQQQTEAFLNDMEREQLVNIATQMQVKFTPKTSTERLRTMLKEALNEKDDD